MREKLTRHRMIVLPLLLVYFAAIAYTAWVSDDGIITFRSIENWFHGYGLVFNPGERVQTFTHPLWMLLQSLLYLITRLFAPPFGLNKLFYGNILLCLALSLVTVILYTFKVARSATTAVLGLLVLTLSKAFIDYSTSGLENPLGHLLALCFFWLFLAKEKHGQHDIKILSFLASLAALNRLDTILIFSPALLFLLWKNPDKLKTVFSIVTGFIPLVALELFSIFYYGIPFPNTAIAKLNTGIPMIMLLKQGLRYFLNSLRLDTITLTVIAFAAALALLTKSTQRIAVGIGMGLYMAYIIYIGGDFMSGRYFSTPLIVAVILLSTFDIKPLPLLGLSSILILAIGLLPFVTTIERRPTYGQNRENNLVFFDKYKIADERLVYADRTSLLAALRHHSPRVIYSQDEWVFSAGYPREVHIVGAMGLNGLRDGPNIHVIDRNGLADPLIARMPLEDTEDWRIGHFHHLIPEGYEATLATGSNHIQDENIALFYDKLSVVVKGELWDWDRILEIWKLNTGQYDTLKP